MGEYLSIFLRAPGRDPARVLALFEWLDCPVMSSPVSVLEDRGRQEIRFDNLADLVQARAEVQTYVSDRSSHDHNALVTSTWGGNFEEEDTLFEIGVDTERWHEPGCDEFDSIRKVESTVCELLGAGVAIAAATSAFVGGETGGDGPTWAQNLSSAIDNPHLDFPWYGAGGWHSNPTLRFALSDEESRSCWAWSILNVLQPRHRPGMVTSFPAFGKYSVGIDRVKEVGAQRTCRLLATGDQHRHQTHGSVQLELNRLLGRGIKGMEAKPIEVVVETREDSHPSRWLSP